MKIYTKYSYFLNRGHDIFADWMATAKIWWPRKNVDLQYSHKRHVMHTCIIRTELYLKEWWMCNQPSAEFSDIALKCHQEMSLPVSLTKSILHNCPCSLAMVELTRISIVFQKKKKDNEFFFLILDFWKSVKNCQIVSIQ